MTYPLIILHSYYYPTQKEVTNHGIVFVA